MSVAISNLLPEMRVELPGIIDPLLNGVTYRVLRKFFWESEAWKYTYDNAVSWSASTLALPSPELGADVPLKTVVKRVDTIFYNADGDNWNKKIPFQTRDELDRSNPDWYTETGSTPTAWTHGNNGAALIIPQHTTGVTDAFLVRAVIAPVYTAMTDTLPDFLYYEFDDAIRHGVLAELMMQPGKDWSNPQQAMMYTAAFAADVKKARSRGQADFGQPKGTMAYGGL